MTAHQFGLFILASRGALGDRMMIRHTPLPSQNAYDILMYHIQQDAMQFRHRGEGHWGMVNRSRTSLEGSKTWLVLIKISSLFYEVIWT